MSELNSVIGVFNKETNYLKLVIELSIFVLIFVILAIAIYKKTKRPKTIIISVISVGFITQ